MRGGAPARASASLVSRPCWSPCMVGPIRAGCGGTRRRGTPYEGWGERPAGPCRATRALPTAEPAPSDFTHRPELPSSSGGGMKGTSRSSKVASAPSAPPGSDIGAGAGSELSRGRRGQRQQQQRRRQQRRRNGAASAPFHGSFLSADSHARRGGGRAGAAAAAAAVTQRPHLAAAPAREHRSRRVAAARGGSARARCRRRRQASRKRGWGAARLRRCARSCMRS